MARKSIHLVERSEQFIADRTQGETPNYSGFINSQLALLDHLAKAEKPNLSNEDWIELYNVYAGRDLTRIATPINVARDLMDHHGATSTSQLPENCKPLVELLVNLTQAHQYAIVDAVRVYWASGE